MTFRKIADPLSRKERCTMNRHQFQHGLGSRSAGVARFRAPPVGARPAFAPALIGRAPLSRRQFLGQAAGAAGLALATPLLWPARAWARPHAAPRPIPGGTVVTLRGEDFFIHHFPPAHGNEPSQITDFHGDVGLCRILGSGTGTDLNTGEEMSLILRQFVNERS
jgi:hypothetical protein